MNRTGGYTHGHPTWGLGLFVLVNEGERDGEERVSACCLCTLVCIDLNNPAKTTA